MHAEEVGFSVGRFGVAQSLQPAQSGCERVVQCVVVLVAHGVRLVRGADGTHALRHLWVQHRIQIREEVVLDLWVTGAGQRQS